MPGSFTLRSPSALGAALLLLFGGSPEHCLPPEDPRPLARVAPDRSEHLLDRPYPSDELRGPDGWIELDGFPLVPPEVGRRFLAGWLAQVAASVSGFSAMSPIYFRFDARPEVAESYAGKPGDDVQLVSLDSDHRVAVRVDFVADSLGDPYVPDGTLRITPDETTPLRSGERYAAIVTKDLARRPAGWVPPDALTGSLRRRAAIATVFTVQDPVQELAALRSAADAAIDAAPESLVPTTGLREAVSLRYEQGATVPSGRPSTLEIVSFADGGEEVTFLDDEPGAPPLTVDLASGPMRVFEATIQTQAFQDPEGRPYQQAGLGIIFDTERSDGWIPFGPDGSLEGSPHPEPMRIVVQVPRETPPTRVLLWGHGSGGDAYEAIQRTDPENDGLEIRERLAALGTILVSSDQPLFGRRFPLIDQGYENNLAVVNVPNLPAFRDNVRQGAVDQHVVLRFVREVLPDLLAAALGGPPPGFDGVGVFGHSIGAQMTGVAAALHDPATVDGLLLNGTGGFQTHSVLASDLFQLEGTVGETIFLLAGVPLPDDPTPAATLGALFGVPEAAWPRIDRFHPLAIPFQLVIDAGDPLPVASAHGLPITVFFGEGDSFVPEEGARWIAEAARDGEFVRCTPGADYNGHFCIYREETGFAEFTRFVDGL